MIRDPTSPHQAIQNAMQELQRGHRQYARRWAEVAAAAAPELEEPWLILASLASPSASVAHLKRALQVNPQSGRARRGMIWAVQRLRKEQAKHSLAGGTLPPVHHAALASTFQEKAGTIPAVEPARSAQTQPTLSVKESEDPFAHSYLEPGLGSAIIVGQDKLASRKRSFLPLLLVLACATIAWAVWPGNALPAMAFIRENISLPQGTPTLPGAPAVVLKPTYTPTFTPTFSPTPTATSTPTPTNTPTPTPTYTPSLTPLPTDTPQPVPTYEPPTPIPLPGGVGERWIDVDLSQQRVYAYEGNVVVASFIVSTGTWQHPTVTGQYYIYIKLLYSNMSGPGYYLPNVPYTMYFYKGYALHGTYWHSNFGTPMSHGCVNLSIPDAEWLFYFASVGTLVNVHY